MSVIREFIVRFGIEADEKKIDKVDRGFQGLVVTLGDVIGIANAAGSALKSFLLGTTEMASAAVDSADRLGTTVEVAQALGFAADQTGASFGDVSVAIKAFRSALDSAAQGSAAAQEAFARLGLDPAAIGDDPVEQLAAVADGLATLTSETERSALAQDLLGRGAQTLRPLLKDGGAGVRAMADEYRRLGLGITDTTARRFEAFGDRLDVFRRITLKLRDDIATSLLPTFERWTTAGIEFVRETRAGENALGKFIARAGGLGPLLKVIGAALVSFGAGFAIVGAINAVTKALAGFSAASLLAAAVPLLAGAAVLALVVIAEDFYTFLHDGDSVLGDIIAKFGDARPGDGPLMKFVRELLRSFTELRDMLHKDILAPLESFGSIFDAHGGMARRIGATAKTGPGAEGKRSLGDMFAAGFEREIGRAVRDAQSLFGTTPQASDDAWRIPMMAPRWAAPGAAAGSAAVVNVANEFKIFSTDPRGAAYQVRGVMDGASKQIGREVERASPTNVR